MTDLSEREERVWKKIEEKETELRQVKEKLEALQTDIVQELSKRPRERDVQLLAYLERREAILSNDRTSLHTELQKFQELLAAGGVCLFAS